MFLFPENTFERLPAVFSSKRDDQRAPRVADFVWETPHVYEIENRLVIPEGFTIPSPATELTRELGPMHFVATQRIDGKTLVVLFRLDTGKRRITPAELERAQQAIRDLRNEDFHVGIANTAWMLTDKHQYNEAITEANRMIQLHPREGLHHKQLAQLLISMGAGDAARREAHKAVELDPKNADAAVVLGWVLEHDTLGRMFGFDHDRAGARVALDHARKINPKHVGAAVELATLLEHDAHGLRYERGSDLRGAIAAWRDAYTLDPSAEHGQSLARALLWSGDAVEAERVARALAVSDARNGILIAAIGAGHGGASAAINAVDTLAGGTESGTNVLAASGAILLALPEL